MNKKIKMNKETIATSSIAVVAIILVITLSCVIYNIAMRKSYSEKMNKIQEEYSLEINDISLRYEEICNNADCVTLYRKLCDVYNIEEKYEKEIVDRWFDIENHEDKSMALKYDTLQKYNRDLSFSNWLLVGELSDKYKDIKYYLDIVCTDNIDCVEYIEYINEYFKYLYTYRNLVIDISREAKEAGDDVRRGVVSSVLESEHYIKHIKLLNSIRNEYYSGIESNYAHHRYMMVVEHIREIVEDFKREQAQLETSEKDSIKESMNKKIASLAKYAK